MLSLLFVLFIIPSLRAADVITLERLETTERFITGELTAGSDFSCKTLELPYRNNENYVSSIPPGEYPLKIKKDNSIAVLEVPSRTYIQIHPGNSLGDTEGCILVGRSIARVKGVPFLTKSKDTLKELTKEIDEETVLKIVE